MFSFFFFSKTTGNYYTRKYFSFSFYAQIPNGSRFFIQKFLKIQNPERQHGWRYFMRDAYYSMFYHLNALLAFSVPTNILALHIKYVNDSFYFILFVCISFLSFFFLYLRTNRKQTKRGKMFEWMLENLWKKKYDQKHSLCIF